MVRRSRVFSPTWVIAAILASLAPGAADATGERERVKACLDCHGNARVLGIAETVHANFDDPRTPAAQKQCQSCRDGCRRFDRDAGSRTLGKVQSRVPVEEIKRLQFE